MLTPFEEDTIAAVSTPPGRGGIGILRLSGPRSLAITSGLLNRQSRSWEHARATFVRVPDPSPSAVPGAVLDEGIVTLFQAPRSYTGEDLVEISTHGSPVVLQTLLDAVLARGARLAEAGEFTRRAFLAGRLDLTQAEAVHDLIAAQTLEQVRAAAQQLGGALSRRVQPIKEDLLHLIALLEAGMDFASGELDDVDVVPPAQIAEVLGRVQSTLHDLTASFRAGALLRSGLTLALVGRPNVGKSSLFNRLLERPRAIVTSVAGTTRDTVEEGWSLQGIPIRLIDTAGLRLSGEAPADEAERQGIERSREALADADLVLLIRDARHTTTAEERELQSTLHGRPHLVVVNKTDLLAEGNPNADPDAIPVSALTGMGIAVLKAAVLQQMNTSGDVAQNGALNSQRQLEHVSGAMASLAAATAANSAAHPHEILLMDLHTALTSLDALTGQTTNEDILGRIFSTFCIGK